MEADYFDIEKRKEIEQGITYAVREGLLEPSEARQMTLEEQEAWLGEHLR